MEVNSMQVEANKAIQNLAAGKTKNIHETMLAVENAEIAFKTMNQIRMKVIEAYKEVMRMQM
jgi:flagellar hook-basal body complex protein FliE